jgi:hypothetical protein
MVEGGNVAELLNRGVLNFNLAHKYDQKLECCVGVAMAKEGEDLLVIWCVLKFPWEFDAELEAKLKENPPFREVKEQLIPRYHFNDKNET